MQKLRRAADVVCVVVGLQNGLEFQPVTHQPLPHWFSDGGIDHHRLVPPCPDPDNVVLQHRQWLDSFALTWVAHR